MERLVTCGPGHCFPAHDWPSTETVELRQWNRAPLSIRYVHCYRRRKGTIPHCLPRISYSRDIINCLRVNIYNYRQPDPVPQDLFSRIRFKSFQTEDAFTLFTPSFIKEITCSFLKRFVSFKSLPQQYHWIFLSKNVTGLLPLSFFTRPRPPRKYTLSNEFSRIYFYFLCPETKHPNRREINQTPPPTQSCLSPYFFLLFPRFNVWKAANPLPSSELSPRMKNRGGGRQRPKDRGAVVEGWTIAGQYFAVKIIHRPGEGGRSGGARDTNLTDRLLRPTPQFPSADMSIILPRKVVLRPWRMEQGL